MTDEEAIQKAQQSVDADSGWKPDWHKDSGRFVPNYAAKKQQDAILDGHEPEAF